mmetsp:Transcript_3569/g.10259  ORF Transcript_3569/g.10259 Transcript_3569/m.10259 type:complete len:488 (-) Transcript_3569:338-1801(-)
MNAAQASTAPVIGLPCPPLTALLPEQHFPHQQHQHQGSYHQQAYYQQHHQGSYFQQQHQGSYHQQAYFQQQPQQQFQMPPPLRLDAHTRTVIPACEVPNPSPTPAGTNLFAPSSLPRLPVSALWDALAGGNGRARNAANAADQVCEQFADPTHNLRLVAMEASNSSMDGSFERDFVLISALGDSGSPTGSTLSDGSNGANAAIANTQIARSAPSSSGAPGSRPPRPPRSPAALVAAHAVEQQPASAAAAVVAAPSPPTAAPAASELTAPSAPAPMSRGECLHCASLLLLKLATARCSSGEQGEVLVLNVLALQALSVAVSLCADHGGPEAALCSYKLRNVMATAVANAQEAAQTVNNPSASCPPDQQLPCPLELAYRLALDYGRAAAVNELMGDLVRSVQEYTAASTLLTFLLSEVPQLPPSGVLPMASIGRELPESDQRRLKRYLQKLQLRTLACMARSTAGPLGSMAAASSPVPKPALGHVSPSC